MAAAAAVTNLFCFGALFWWEMAVAIKILLFDELVGPSWLELENNPLGYDLYALWMGELCCDIVFLAPSGALIAILTYYWPSTTTTHFFRSHGSSIKTLDFHFLSHNSYIKGNHWTWSAGFMDTLWVRLGITDDDLGHLGHYLGTTWGWSGHYYFGKTWQDLRTILAE